MATVFDALDREWLALARDRAAARELATVCAEAGVANLGQLETWVRAASARDADRVLLALVVQASAGSALAVRVALQLLQPGVRRLVRRRGSSEDGEERAAAVLAAVCHRIRHYPVSARPGRVAANVLMDAAQEVARRDRHRHAMVPCDWSAVDDRELPASLRAGEVHEVGGAAEELLAVVVQAVVAGHVKTADAELIVATRIAGRRLASLATQRGTPLRTLQWRRRAAELALAGAAA